MKPSDIVKKYAHFISYRPWIMILIVILLSVLAFSQAGKVGTKSMDNKDMLPDKYPVIHAFNILEDEFGTTDSVMIVVEIDPTIKGSSEPRDIRDPKVIQYIDLLGKYVTHVNYVRSVTSVATILRNENTVLPKTLHESISQIDESAILSQFVSPDAEMAIMTVSLEDDYDIQELVKDLQESIDVLEKPAGLKVSVAGELVADPIVEEQIGPDMAKTGNVSMIMIIVILLILIRSFVYGLSPLLVIIIGISWCFGYMGLTGMNISSAGSGVVSMIMGIGIDFGIQILVRYRYELGILNDPASAMEKTMSNVIIPMATTTLSALIGFKAMSMGELTFLAELGTIMSYGIAACFLVAITLLPPFMVLIDSFRFWLKKRKSNNKINKLKSYSKGESNVKRNNK